MTLASIYKPLICARIFNNHNFNLKREISRERKEMDAATTRQLKIKTGCVVRTKKDHVSYSNEQNTLQGRIEEAQKAQADLPAEQQDAGVVNRLEAQLAETVAVIPTIVVKIEQYLNDLQSFMATVEANNADQMDAIRETEEWQAAQTAADEAQAFVQQ